MQKNITTIEVGSAQISVDTNELFRAWFEKHLTGSPAKFVVPSDAGKFLVLNDGEKYVGAITTPAGKTSHIILLPGEVSKKNWKESLEWARSIGGDLPDRMEQALLYNFMRDEFKPEAYWSNTQHASDSDYAWYQNFFDGIQYSYHKLGELRARAVRRSII